MTKQAEGRADAALVGDAPELMAAFLANADKETADAIAKLINADDTEVGDLLYEKLIEYAERLA